MKHHITKSAFIFILLLILLGGSIATGQDELAPEGTPGETYFAPFPVAITLDGEIDDWAGVPTVHLGGETAPGLTFAVAADDNFLYVMGDVIDNNIITGQHGENYWNEDSVEFYINGTGNLLLPYYEDGAAQITIPAMNKDLPPEEAVLSGVRGSTADAQVYTVETETGYRVEMAVPLKNDVWSISPYHGNIIGFQAHLNYAGTSDRDGKLVWSIFDTADQSYQNPSLFGFLVFYEVGNAEVIDVPGTIAQLTLPPEADPMYVPVDAAYKNPYLSTDERVEDLLARMSLEEKIGQMTLVEKNSMSRNDIAPLGIGALLSGGGGYPSRGNTPENWATMVAEYQDFALQSRLGIPLLYGVDAVHGHNNLEGAVIFPHNIGLGATRDAELVKEVCHITAGEVLGTGIYWNYAPVLAVVQDIRWGRTYEAYGEQTDLVTELSLACLQGLQGDDPGNMDTLLATPKHYIGDGGTTWGTSTTGDYIIDRGDTQIDEVTLRELYLPPYEAAVENGAMSIMVSYSSWNGTKMHGEAYLINDVLKGELGFEGFIVSDWQGIDEISPGDYYNAVVTSINAGVDMNMVPYNYNAFISVMLQAVENGDISEERIDDAVSRILKAKFELGLFEWPYRQSSYTETIGSEEHRAVAREAVSKSLVLLQNENEALPIAQNTPVIFVAGDGADDIGIQSGGWTIEWQGAEGDITPGTTILEAVKATASGEVYYDRLARFRAAKDSNGDPLMADVGIIVISERPYAEGVGDSADLTLPEIDINVLKRMQERCEKVVVIILSGRPIIITDLLQYGDAFVAAWLPGTEGAGITDVLFGDVPFTGRLPFTWPRSVDQLPLDFENLTEEDVLFPYGYGLTAP